MTVLYHRTQSGTLVAPAVVQAREGLVSCAGQLIAQARKQSRRRPPDWPTGSPSQAQKYVALAVMLLGLTTALYQAEVLPVGTNAAYWEAWLVDLRAAADHLRTPSGTVERRTQILLERMLATRWGEPVAMYQTSLPPLTRVATTRRGCP